MEGAREASLVESDCSCGLLVWWVEWWVRWRLRLSHERRIGCSCWRDKCVVFSSW